MRTVDEAEYAICKRRGHESNGTWLTTNVAWTVCKWCGVDYRIETIHKVIEAGAPNTHETTHGGSDD